MQIYNYEKKWSCHIAVTLIVCFPKTKGRGGASVQNCSGGAVLLVTRTLKTIITDSPTLVNRMHCFVNQCRADVRCARFAVVSAFFTIKVIWSW